MIGISQEPDRALVGLSGGHCQAVILANDIKSNANRAALAPTPASIKPPC